MRDFYSILHVTPEQRTGDEQLGTKPKFWFKSSSDGNQWLFKETRKIIEAPQGVEFAGEDWAEKVASEIAYSLNIPAAEVKLADYQGRRGCASKNFTNALADTSLQLIHGNEILAGYVPNYDKTLRFGQSKHTIENIIFAIQSMFKTESRSVLTQLANYVVLDALIGNVDRHHENWGLLWEPVVVRTDDSGKTPLLTIKFMVAPTYDHASSLGRELTDVKRVDKLRGGAVESYVRKGRGGIYVEGRARAENPLDLVETAAVKYPEFFRVALNTLQNTALGTLTETVARVPDSRISPSAREFATEMLRVSYNALTRIGQ
jgi:hypothetical protein